MANSWQKKAYLFRQIIKLNVIFIKESIEEITWFLFMSWMASVPFPMDNRHSGRLRFVFKFFQLLIFIGLMFYWPAVLLPIFVILIVGGHLRNKREIAARHIWH